MTDRYSYTDVKALFDAIIADQAHTNGTDPDGEWELPTPIVDWNEAYGLGDDPARWLAEPLLPDGGAVAIFAKGGTGKSLLALWLAAGLATGSGLAGPTEPIEVLYLDYEMTIRDVVERLEDMGYDDPEQLDHLHYASLPTLSALDTPEGGKELLAMAQHLKAKLVVIDTFGRAVNGEENEADTVRNWYRCTGRLLKAAGIAYVRIDHAGKDLKKGQRGSSAKNDDVDIVWEMTAGDGRDFILRTTKRRVSWVPERIGLVQTDDNGILAYTWDGANKGYLAGTRAVADLLDEYGAPVDISRRKALLLLREHGNGRATEVVGDAIRYRRELQDHSQNHPKSKGTGPMSGPKAKAQQVTPENHTDTPPGPQPPGWVAYVVGTPGVADFPGLFDDLPEIEQ